MIKVNGRDMEWEKDLTVDLLLKKRKYPFFPLMIVKINGRFIPREEWDVLVMDNDDVQVIHM